MVLSQPAKVWDAMTYRASVVHTIAGLRDQDGGVARSVPGLCEALARQGCRIALITQRPMGTNQASLLTPDPKLVDVRFARSVGWEHPRLSFAPGLVRKLSTMCAEIAPAILHDHGVWLHMNHAAAVTARRLGLRRVVSPRGMLDGWAMSYHSWKKRLAWHAYQERDLRSANAFCATSKLEAEAIRNLGLAQPIAIIPNGVDVPTFEERRPRSVDRVVLFLSRLHEKKGVLDLIAAWASAPRPGWRLVIAGPDEGGYRRVLEDAVARAGVMTSVTFAGAVAGQAKHALLRDAEVFVLPSYSENFGIVVAEALAYGVPVITTHATPWEELSDHNCGWWIPTGTEALKGALMLAMALSSEERRSMGQRGAALIAERYSWPSIALKHISFYAWLTGASPPPSFVLTGDS